CRMGWVAPWARPTGIVGASKAESGRRFARPPSKRVILLDEEEETARRDRDEPEEADLAVTQPGDPQEHLAPLPGGQQRQDALEQQHQANGHEHGRGFHGPPPALSGPRARRSCP